MKLKCECPDAWTGFPENMPYCPLHNPMEGDEMKAEEQFKEWWDTGSGWGPGGELSSEFMLAKKAYLFGQQQGMEESAKIADSGKYAVNAGGITLPIHLRIAFDIRQAANALKEIK